MSEQSQAGFRSDAIYVEWQTRKAFYYIPREDGESVDALVNKVLADWLKQNHPRVVEHLKSQQSSDKLFKEEYFGKKEPF